ncbi:DUF5131 family protein [Breznakia pachnodae]|uniref:Protein gp37 n=1 Tax=Breznakia pachnodae TaxID=265178 RepID=A0ABU0E485_9FIRM|nr:DUF5131 family protein [Breznakia pachnodae]MDQ0361620.1 protein gp37 [Breznakia pachnodae]
MGKTKIEWCDETVNPVIGCTYGCSYCYAARLNKRFKWVKEWGKPEVFPDKLDYIAKLRKPKNIFMNSMSDVADWNIDIVKKVNRVMHDNSHHNYLFLTKRPEAISYYLGINTEIWLGVTYTTDDDWTRLGCLIEETSARRKFLSIEPLHDEVSIAPKYLNQIDWIIIGAETGNRKGKIIPKKEWIMKIVEEAKKHNVPVFMKDSLIEIIGKDNILQEFPIELIAFYI